MDGRAGEGACTCAETAGEVSEGMEFRARGVVIVCMWKLSLFAFVFGGGVLFALTIVLFHAVEIVITFPNSISSRKRITP